MDSRSTARMSSQQLDRTISVVFEPLTRVIVHAKRRLPLGLKSQSDTAGRDFHALRCKPHFSRGRLLTSPAPRTHVFPRFLRWEPEFDDQHCAQVAISWRCLWRTGSQWVSKAHGTTSLSSSSFLSGPSSHLSRLFRQGTCSSNSTGTIHLTCFCSSCCSLQSLEAFSMSVSADAFNCLQCNSPFDRSFVPVLQQPRRYSRCKLLSMYQIPQYYPWPRFAA